MSIACFYCGKEGAYGQLHAGGWILAKSRWGCYACTDCAPIDNRKDKPTQATPNAHE